MISAPVYELKAASFRTLEEPTRIRILEASAAGERSVGELLPYIGIEPSALSQQLRDLQADARPARVGRR